LLCILRRGRRKMTVVFSMGRGLEGRAPEAVDVLDCLAMDAAGVRNAADFEGWCSEYGFDADSRKAEKTFKACEKQASQLERFIGDAFDQLLELDR
jgi:hypothetical protein